MSESKEALNDLFDLLCEREHTNSEHCFYLKLYNTIEKDLDELDRAEGLLKALLQDMYVEYSGKDEVYIIKGVYDKKSKVYQQIQEYFKDI